MKVDPVICREIHCSYAGVAFHLSLTSNLTMILGESGNGKTFLYKALRNYKVMDDTLLLFDFTDIHRVSDELKKAVHRFIIVDNADIMLDDDMRNFIAFDYQNQYLLIGRDPRGLMVSADNLKSVHFDKNSRTMELVDAV